MMVVHPGSVFIDSSSLRNFASVGHLDLLKVHFGDRLILTETVRDEITRAVPHEDSIQRIVNGNFLDSPLAIEPPVEGALRIEYLRQGLGGEGQKPRQHLGEAEIIYYMETHAPGTVFFTDDRPAHDFARNRGLAAINSADVLRECYSCREIGCPDAFDLLLEMAAEGRGVYVPDNHLLVCDPMARPDEFGAGSTVVLPTPDRVQEE